MTESSYLTSYELTAERESPRRTRVATGDAEFVVGHDVNPVEYFLGAVLACLNSTGTMVARDMDVEIDDLSMRVDGDVDYAAYRGEPSDERPGLHGLDVTLAVEADADEETLRAWLDAVEDRCPVTDNVENLTPLDVELDRT